MFKKIITRVTICTLIFSLFLPNIVLAGDKVTNIKKTEGTINVSNHPARSTSDISSSANVLTATNANIINSELDDGCVGSFDIGFDFDFFDTTFDSVYISTNGTVSFEECTTDYENEFNFLDETGYTEDLPKNTIFAFWDDLETRFDNIYYTTYGEPGTQKFVVQWTNIYSHEQRTEGDEDYDFYGPPLGTIQVILDEATGDITLQYIDILQGGTGQGMEATIGLLGDFGENEDVVFSHLEETVYSNYAVTFSPEDETYDYTETEFTDIYLDDGNLPDNGMNFWYALDSNLVDSTRNFDSLNLSEDALIYSEEGTENLPMVGTSGDYSLLRNNSLIVPGGDLQLSMAFYPNSLPTGEDQYLLMKTAANGGVNDRTNLYLNSDGTLTFNTNLLDLETQDVTTESTVNVSAINYFTAIYFADEKQWSIYLNNEIAGSTTTYTEEGNFSDITYLFLPLGSEILSPGKLAFDGLIGAIGSWDTIQDEEYLSNIYNEGNVRSYEYMFVENSDTTTPTLNWNPYQNTDYVELIVSTSPSFETGAEDERDYARLNNSVVFQEDNIEAFTYTFEPETTPFQEGETYYWILVLYDYYTEGPPSIQTSPYGTFTIPYTHEFSGEGEGTDEDPYLISSCEELMEVNDLLFDELYFELTTDLDCTVNGNNIIIGDEDAGFEGQFNGAGFTVTVDLDGEFYTALFGKLNGAVVENLTVEGTIESSMAGGIAGLAVDSLLSNVTATANTIVTGTGQERVTDENPELELPEIEDNVGGIVGFLYKSSLQNSFSNATVTGVWENIGGAVGHAVRSEITNSGTNANVSGNTDTGGFAGDIDLSDVSDSYSDGVVEGVEYVGGFVGDSDTFAEYNRVYSDATVTASQGSVGGFMGTADYFIELNQVYATGNVTEQSAATTDGEEINNYYAGGLIGNVDTGVVIEDAYAIGDVFGDVVGGLIGIVEEDDVPSTITNTYSKGEVTTNGEYGLGGLIAINVDGNTVLNSFWNTDTSGTTESDAGTGISITQMRDQSTFTDWNFDEIWEMDEENVINGGYPYFGWQEEVLEYTDEVASARSGSTSGSRAKKVEYELTYAEEVAAMIEAGIVTENPEDVTNKCEALVMMARVFDWNVGTETNDIYTDTPEWCGAYAKFGTERGIVEGRTATTLGMETPVTRYEVATMIFRELKVQDFKFNGLTNPQFADALIEWAKEAVLSLAKEGIIKGFANNTFGGEKNILKQDLGIMLLRI